MAYYQVLYWQQIPTQFKVWDDFDEINVELGPKFMALVDKTAQAKGLISTDDYLAQLNWSEEKELEGEAEEVVDIIREKLNTEFIK